MRQRAVDLLYAMCDKNNAEEIVSEMLTYLETADYSIKEEMVRNKILFWVLVCGWVGFWSSIPGRLHVLAPSEGK